MADVLSPETEALLGAEARVLDEHHVRHQNVRDDASEWPSAMDVAAMHGIAGEFVRAIAPNTEADPAAILVQFLVHFGALVGRGPHFRVEGDEHHANLYAVLVGDSGKGRKGTSASRVRCGR